MSDQEKFDTHEFECNDCHGKFTQDQGTWPRNDLEGNPLYVTYVNSWEDKYLSDDVPFVCYDCAG